MACNKGSGGQAWQGQRTNQLASELRSVLALLPLGIGLAELLEQPLSALRRGLAPQAQHDTPWHLLPLMVCESVGGNYENALPVAAAFQLMLAAGDVLDDIADNDSHDSLSAKYGFGAAVNAATTLMILAEQAITRLKERKVSNSGIVRLIRVFNSYFSKACGGQHLDLTQLNRNNITENRYLKIVGLKSASQIECACHTGALIGGAKRDTIHAFRKFGYNLGMAAQITNDMMGITTGKDIANRKITLPVIFALNTLEKRRREQVEKVYCVTPGQNEVNIQQIQDIFSETGALYYANLKRHIYQRKALEVVSNIKNYSADINWGWFFLGK